MQEPFYVLVNFKVSYGPACVYRLIKIRVLFFFVSFQCRAVRIGRIGYSIRVSLFTLLLGHF